MAKALRKITADEFSRRLKKTSEDSDKRFAFFLGAGCSVSSGIPAAGDLVRNDWLPRLRDFKAPDRKDLATWAREIFPEFQPESASALYGKIIEELFLHPEERQREIERLCEGKFPGFGYAVLSQLMAIDRGLFNVVLTTNFDDLIADALYLFTQSRPLVILHESLSNFIRPTRTRPLVVKLHGDHRLAPKNTELETEEIKEEIEKQIRTLLYDRGLIFIGYGGHDQGIKMMFEKLPLEALPLGIFWIGSREPENEIRPWLEYREAVWVESRDFDELMLLIRDIFNLPHPERERFDEVFDKYAETYKALSGRVAEKPDTVPDAAALKEAVKRTDVSFPDWLSLGWAAERLAASDPEQAQELFEKGIKKFPDSAPLLGAYARFLHLIRNDYNGAEEYYSHALDVDPKNAMNLGNYASFLYQIRKDYNRAEEFYRRALEADPKHANHLGNYATFLYQFRKDYDRAEEFYRRALEADPEHAIHLGNYANFLYQIRKDYNRAEEIYRRILKDDPTNANHLGNFSASLLSQGKNEEGLETLDRVLRSSEISERPDILVECWFYALAHRPKEARGEALHKLKQLIQQGARSPRWNLAPNLERARQEGHPDIVWLEKLARVITDGAEPSVLEDWPAWKEA